ncbi:glycyl-radical enzyme activating protein, partial [Faecalibaculum rodentium]|uniref:glycyl-radical enzyme activating protein n=1 Tax=Faecalibaculum rodentium TaxID=1702221 RepID=UPI00261AD293
MRQETEKTSVQDDILYTITSSQRFATPDGPGIRTVVFFKGCPLHCPWCANPETWQKEPELFHDDSLCTGCGRCVLVCPKRAVAVIDGKARVNRRICDGCAKCTDACLNKAMEVTGKRMTIPEILVEIRKDDEYYQASGGGITLSGGEIFAQDPVPLLKTLKEQGYHTAIET